MSELFRKQAIEHKKDRLLGDVIIIQPISTYFICITLVLFLLTFIGYVSWGKYSRKQTVNGYLSPTQGVIKIYSPQMGIISKVMVSEGDFVKKGQDLFILRTSKNLVSGGDEENLIISKITKQIEMLKESLNRTRLLYEFKNNEQKYRYEMISDELLNIKYQEEIIKKRIDLEKRQFERLKFLLEKKLISKDKVDEFESKLLKLKSERNTLERERTKIRQEMKIINEKGNILKFDRKEKNDDIKMQISRLEQELIQYRAGSQFVVKAERDGLISALQIKLGQYITTKTPLTSLIPSNSVFQSKLLVPTNAIGFVEEGQIVTMRYSAFPYQKFGLQYGKIIHVSKNVLLPDELNDSPIKLNNPVYIVSVSLDSQQVNAYGRFFPLRSGIELSADIQLGERSLLEWLLEPIYSLKGHFS